MREARQAPERRDETARRLLAVIEGSRPAAVAGWPEYWARIAGLDAAEATEGLEALAGRGLVRRQRLDGRTLYVADPPHASGSGRP